jgi:hypothetical protein
MNNNFDLKQFLAEGRLLKEQQQITADYLYQMFQDEDLIDDRREYDEEDLMNAYPGLSQSEAKKLISLLGNESIDESSLNEDNLQQDIEDFRDSVETDNYQRSKDNDPDYEVAEPSVEFFLDLYPKYKGKEREIQQILNSPLTQNIKNSISDKGDVKNQIRDLKAKYIAGDSSVLPQLKALQSKLR